MKSIRSSPRARGILVILYGPYYIGGQLDITYLQPIIITAMLYGSVVMVADNVSVEIDINFVFYCAS